MIEKNDVNVPACPLVFTSFPGIPVDENTIETTMH